jgi:hypothetical protein
MRLKVQIFCFAFIISTISLAQVVGINKSFDYQNDKDEGVSIVAVEDGYIIANYGYVYANLQGAIKLLKVDSLGNEVWHKAYGRATNHNLLHLRRWRDSDTLIGCGRGVVELNGVLTFKAFLFYTNANGDSLGIQYFGTNLPEYSFSNFEATPDGGLVAIGYSYDLSNTKQRALVVKYDANLQVQWTKTFASLNGNGGTALTIVVLDTYIYVGSRVVNFIPNLDRVFTDIRKYDLAGRLVNARQYDRQEGIAGAFLFKVGQDIYLHALGDTSSIRPRPSLYSYWAKLDTNLNIIWKQKRHLTKKFPLFSSAHDLANGQIILAGTLIKAPYAIYNESDGYIAKVDSLGNFIWEREYRGPRHDIPDHGFFAMNKTKDGFLVTGRIINDRDSSHVNSDIWLMGLDTNGCLSPTNCGHFISLPEEPLANQSSFKAYPNPVTDNLSIEYHLGAGGQDGFVKIYNLNKVEVYQQSFKANGQNILNVNTSDWAAGIYVIEYGATKAETQRTKIIVQP